VEKGSAITINDPGGGQACDWIAKKNSNTDKKERYISLKKKKRDFTGGGKKMRGRTPPSPASNSEGDLLVKKGKRGKSHSPSQEDEKK